MSEIGDGWTTLGELPRGAVCATRGGALLAKITPGEADRPWQWDCTCLVLRDGREARSGDGEVVPPGHYADWPSGLPVRVVSLEVPT